MDLSIIILLIFSGCKVVQKYLSCWAKLKIIFINVRRKRRNHQNQTSKRMYSDMKFTSHKQHLQLTLNLQHVRKPVVSILRQLYLTNRLPIFPFENYDSYVDPAKQLISKSMQFQGGRFRRSCMNTEPLRKVQYSLNNNEALQLIWKGALFERKKKISDYHIKELSNSQYIGQMNILNKQIEEMTLALNSLSLRKRTTSQEEIKYGQQIARGLEIMKKQLEKQWSKIRQKQRERMRQLESYPYTSLMRLQLTESQRDVIIPYIRRKLIDIDRKILKDSVLFVMEMNKYQCIVTLESPYECFKAKIIHIKHLLGEAYQEAIKDIELARKQFENKGEPFDFNKIRVCHKCLDIKNVGQGNDFVCKSTKIAADPTLRPYVFQNILLYSDFSAVPEVYKNQIFNSLEEAEQYKDYGYPYFKTYTRQCGRYLCSDCVEQYKSSKKKMQNNNINQDDKMKPQQNICPQNQKRKGRPPKKPLGPLALCPFCECLCDCERCSLAETFNRFAAYYQAHGGNFMKQVLPEIVFLNFRNKHYKFSYTKQEDFDQWSKQQIVKALSNMRQLDFTVQLENQMNNVMIPEVNEEKEKEIVIIDQSVSNRNSSSRNTSTNKYKRIKHEILQSPKQKKKRIVEKIVQEISSGRTNETPSTSSRNPSRNRGTVKEQSKRDLRNSKNNIKQTFFEKQIIDLTDQNSLNYKKSQQCIKFNNIEWFEIKNPICEPFQNDAEF